MLSKIDVRQIVKDHAATLYELNSDSRSRSRGYALFFGVPVLLGAAALIFSICLDDQAASDLVTALAVLVGLLLNLLLLTYDIINKAKGSSDRLRLIQETYSNISFAVLISLAAIIALVVIQIQDEGLVGTIASAISIALLANILLTLLMIIKRVHVLLRGEYQDRVRQEEQ